MTDVYQAALDYSSGVQQVQDAQKLYRLVQSAEHEGAKKATLEGIRNAKKSASMIKMYEPLGEEDEI